MSKLRRCAVSVNAKVNIAIAQRAPVVVLAKKRFVGWDIPPLLFRTYKDSPARAPGLDSVAGI
jgi:hypothetical protein